MHAKSRLKSHTHRPQPDWASIGTCCRALICSTFMWPVLHGSRKESVATTVTLTKKIDEDNDNDKDVDSNNGSDNDNYNDNRIDTDMRRECVNKRASGWVGGRAGGR